MNTLKIAVYNVFRNKRRTLITLLSIISASVAIIVFGGFISYTFTALREITIHTQLGHFQVATKGYFNKGAGLEAKDMLMEPDPIEEKLRGFEHIKAVTRRLSGSGLISSGEVTLTGVIIGVEPEKEDDFTFSETLVDGSYLMPLDPMEDKQCVLGKGLAQGLSVKVGQSVTILSTTLEGMINGMDCEVAGIVSTGSKSFDAVYLKMHLGDLQALMDTPGIEKMLVLLDDTANVPKAAPAIKEYIDSIDHDIREWIDLAEFYRSVVNLYTSIFMFSAVVLAAVVLLSIANTMSMCVFERFREIGTMRAIGETRAGIMRLFLCEGFVIGVLGGLLGIVAGIIAAKIINMAGGIDIAAPPGMSAGYTALITPDFPYFIWSFAISVIASVGASIYPSFKASRLDIVKALQHV